MVPLAFSHVHRLLVAQPLSSELLLVHRLTLCTQHCTAGGNIPSFVPAQAGSADVSASSMVSGIPYPGIRFDCSRDLTSL